MCIFLLDENIFLQIWIFFVIKPDSESEKEFVSSSSLVFISHFLVTPRMLLTVLMLLAMLNLSLSGISAILQSLIVLLVSHDSKMTRGINSTYL